MLKMDREIEELLPFYLLGTLTPEEEQQVQTYLESDPEARAWLEEMQWVPSALPLSAGSAEVAPDVKQKLMERVQKDEGMQPTPTRRRGFLDSMRSLLMPRGGGLLLPATAAVCLVLAVAALIWALSLSNQVAALNREIASLQGQLSNQQQVITDLEEQLQNREQVIAQLTSPGVNTFEITGTEFQPQASGRLFAGPESQTGILVLSGLRPLAPGSVYQLWLIEGESPQSAGVFEVDAQGEAALLVQAPAAIDSFDALGVSIEPEGGSTQPTGDIVMLSELS
jgi:anti-sigma-K factor RskA